MACLDEKITAGLTGAGVTATDTALILSTATGPGFFAAATGWIVAVAGFVFSLARLAVCLDQNGQPEMAKIITEKANQMDAEVTRIKEWALSLGATL
jgi:hypothetical protein